MAGILDAGGRSRFDRNRALQRRMQATFLFVVLTLAVLSVVPYWTGRYAELLRQEAESTIRPAGRSARRLELALAMQTAAERGYAITGHPALFVESRVAAANGNNNLNRLRSLAPRFELPVQNEFKHVDQLAREWYHFTRSQTPDPAGIVPELPERQRQYEELIDATDRLLLLLEQASRQHDAAILAAQQRALTATVALFVLAIFAAAAAAWMMWRQRMLVAQFDWATARARKSAEEEQALRAAAAAVAAPITTDEVIRQIARGALEATGARGAFMGRFVNSSGKLEIIAAAGKDVPVLGDTMVYAGTEAEQVIRTRSPIVIRNLDGLIQNRTIVVLPMIDAEGPIGILTLAYDPDVDPGSIGLDALARASTFADLATVALRKARLLEESENRRQELQRLSDSRALLLRGFSHDLKNPLWAADGFLQLLEAGVPGPLTPEQGMSVHRARRSLASGFKLIHDLLDLARAGTDHIELNIETCDINELLCEVVEEHRASAENKKITLTMKEDDRVPTMATDKSRVRQIVSNLLSNAVKYTQAGGRVDVHVQLQPQREAEPPWVAVHVTDTGPGIASENQKIIFQEFVRLEISKHEPGAGIGLAISQRVAKALGGQITVRSRVGVGSTFTLWLPLRYPTQDQVDRAA